MRYEIEENLRCFKCGRSNVGPLFLRGGDPELVYNTAKGKDEMIDAENYIVHHDCLCCYTCKAWDFPDPDLWTHPVLVSGFTCDCGGTRLEVTENDVFADVFAVECLRCGKAHELKKEAADE